MADALGDLPLAIAQGAGYVADTGMLAGEYLDLLTGRQALTGLGRHALARIDDRGLQMHRLTQAIVRSQLPLRPGCCHPGTGRGDPDR